MADERPVNVLAPGEVIDGRYRVVSHVGVGALGDVYIAEHVRLQKRVAVKLLATRSLTDGSLARLRREARVLGQLSHTNVNTARDFGQGDAGAYLAMDLLEGRSLASHIEERVAADQRVEWHEALRLCLALCQALEASHSAGVLHRDLRPTNVFLSGDDFALHHIQISDFGLASDPDPESDASTAWSPSMGAPAFLAPEQVKRSEPASKQTDLYAVGATLRTALLLRPPYSGAILRAAYKVMSDAPLEGSLRDERGDCPSLLLEAIERAMHADPDERFASASALLAHVAPLVGDAELTPSERAALDPWARNMIERAQLEAPEADPPMQPEERPSVLTLPPAKVVGDAD